MFCLYKINELKKMGDFIEIKDFTELQVNSEEKSTKENDTKQLPKSEEKENKVKATRKDLQISRRLFHMGNGCTVATAYLFTLSHKQVIHIMGTCACIFYLLDQIRISYPSLAKKFEKGSKYLLRAEEQLKESAAVPYLIATLLTLLSFPKIVAVASIYTLALADPLSAIIGIRFGKHHIVKNKSVEGSIAFFSATFFCISTVFIFNGISGFKIWAISFFVALTGTIFEMLPLKIDDNLTIPLFTAFMLWSFCALFGIPI